MAFRSQVSVGLDIGSRYAKAVQLKKSGRNIELEKFGFAEIYPGGEKPTDSAAQRAAQVDAIRRALQEGGIEAKNAVTAVAGESVIVRYIQLPEMPEAELQNALRWEAEEYIPFRIDEVNIDSSVIGKSQESGKTDVLLVCARKDLVEEHIAMVKEAGLVPAVIDVDSFAFLNCFEINYQPESEEAVALVNIGGDITSISVYLGGAPRFSRDISVGGNNITTTIQQRLEVSLSEAEALKVQHGAPKSDGSADQTAPQEGGALADAIRNTVEEAGGDETGVLVSRAIGNTLNNMIGEIRRSIQFFENQSRGVAVGKLLLGGGSASLSGIDAFIQSELDIPVEIIDPLRRIPIAEGDLDADFLRDNRHTLSVGIGLALRKVVD